MNGPVVVKVGGSLLDWPDLPERLGAFLASREPERCLLIVGGGETTDVIRDLDRIHGLGQVRSHDLALRSLDLTAHILETLRPELTVVERPDQLGPAWEQGRVPILAPRRFLLDVDAHSAKPLEAHWDVTSDSIAARVASLLGASELVLLKSRSLPPDIGRAEAARLGLVDPAFLDVARPLGRISYINLRQPHTITCSF